MESHFADVIDHPRHNQWYHRTASDTVYPKKYAHGFVVLCFVVVMQSFIMNSHEVFIHIHQGCFAGTGVIVILPQCQWSKPDGYGKISQCITTTKHSKANTVCIFLGIYCSGLVPNRRRTIIWSKDGIVTDTYMRHSATMILNKPRITIEMISLKMHQKYPLPELPDGYFSYWC